MLFLLCGFLFHNILVVGWGYPVFADILLWGSGSFTLLFVYLFFFLFSFLLVFFLRHRSLRYDSRLIGDFNLYLVRSLFWCVLLVGVVDFTIALLRVEKMLPILFGDDLARRMIHAHFIGPYIHVPLIIIGFILGYFTRTLGFVWLSLLIVGAELLIVISRFLFSYEQALMGDLVRYWYAALFLFSSAYTLLDDGHVRVDVLYANFTSRTKGLVNALGAILMGLTTCWTIIIIGLASKQAIINSPILNFEVSQTGGTGMFIKYQMAAFLGIFAITMFLQFISMFFDSVSDYHSDSSEV